MNEMTAGTPSQKTSAFAPMKKTGSAYNDAQQQKKKKMGITLDSVSERYGTTVDPTFSVEVKNKDKKYTLSSDEIRGVQDLYKQTWNDYYEQDDEDQWNKANGVMPRSFSNGYKKEDKALYDLGLPSWKYLDKYLEAYRTAKAEQDAIEADYKAKQTRLNEFYKAVGEKWLSDEQQNGNYNAASLFKDYDEAGNDLGTATSWEHRRQNQFFDTLNSPEWADVRAMYKANEKQAKAESEYDNPRDYNEALYKAQYQNKDFTEEQQAKNIYNVNFNFDDFTQAYNDNLRGFYAKQRFVDEETGESFTGQEVFDIAGNMKAVQAAFSSKENFYDYVSDNSGDYLGMLDQLAGGYASNELIGLAKDQAIKNINKNKDLTAKERKAQRNAVNEKYNSIIGGRQEQASPNAKEEKPSIDEWIEKETGVRLRGDKIERSYGGVAHHVSHGSGVSVNPNDLTDIFKKMEKAGYSQDEIKKAHRRMLGSGRFASQREKIETEYYHNYDGGINKYASKLANGFEDKGATSALTTEQVLERISKLADSGALNSNTTFDNELYRLRAIDHVSSAVLRDAVNQYLSAADRDGDSDGYARGDIAPYVNGSNIDALKAWGYTERSMTSSDGQRLRDRLNAFVDQFEKDEHGALIEMSRAKFEGRFDAFDIDQAFSRVGWQDAIPIEQRAMDYFIAYGHADDVMSGDNKDEALRYYKMSDDERKAESAAVWASMTPEEQQAYVENFDLMKDFNPVLNKSYGQQVTQQFVGAFAKVAVGLVKGAINLHDMTNKWFANSVSAEFIDDIGRERYEKYTQDRQQGIDEFRKVHAAISQYGKAQGQDGVSNLISLGSDVMSEVLRMTTMNFIGGGFGNVIAKVGNITGGITTLADGTTAISRGLGIMTKVASQMPFISDAIGNYWEEAMQEEGVTTGAATVYALICGTLEGAVEALNMDAIAGGLLGGNRLAEHLIKNGKLAMNAGFRFKCKLIGLCASALGEGGEEGLSNVVSKVLGNFTIRRNQFDSQPKTLGGIVKRGFENWSWSEFWNDVAMGALVGLVANGISGENQFSPEYIICDEMMKKGINPTGLEILHGMGVVNSMSKSELDDYRAHSTQADLLSDDQMREYNKTLIDCMDKAQQAQEQFDATVKNRQELINKAEKQVKRFATARRNALNNNDTKKATQYGKNLAEWQIKVDQAKADLNNNLPKWQANLANQVAPFRSQYLVAEDAIKRHWVAFDSAMGVYKMGLSARKKSSAVNLELSQNYDNAMRIFEDMGRRVTAQDLKNAVDSTAAKADADENVAPVVADADAAIQDGEELAQAIREDGAEGVATLEQAKAEQNAQVAEAEKKVAESEQKEAEPQAETKTEEQPSEQPAEAEATPTEPVAEQAPAIEEEPNAEPAPEPAPQPKNDPNRLQFTASEEELRKQNIDEGRIELDANAQESVRKYAKAVFKVDVTFTPMSAGMNGYNLNGKIYLNTFQLNRKGASVAEVGKMVFLHELTHSLEGTSSYGVLQNLVKRAIVEKYGKQMGFDESTYEEKFIVPYYLDPYNAQLQKNGQPPINLSGARREAIADFIAHTALVTDESGAETVKAFADFIARENGGLAGHIFNSITNFIKRFGKRQDAFSKILYDSQKVWAKALKEANVDMGESMKFVRTESAEQPAVTEETAPKKKSKKQTQREKEDALIASVVNETKHPAVKLNESGRKSAVEKVYKSAKKSQYAIDGVIPPSDGDSYYVLTDAFIAFRTTDRGKFGDIPDISSDKNKEYISTKTKGIFAPDGDVKQVRLPSAQELSDYLKDAKALGKGDGINLAGYHDKIIPIFTQDGELFASVNGEYLLDALKFMGNVETVVGQMKTPLSPLILSSPNTTDSALVVPVRVGDEGRAKDRAEFWNRVKNIREQNSNKSFSFDVNQPLKKLSDNTYETADGGVVTQFSLAYAPRTEADVAKEVDRLVQKGFSKEDAERYVASQTSLAALTVYDMLDSGALNYMADDRYNAIKKNSDYKQGTIDFINDCVKRRPFTNILAEVQRANPDRVFNATDLEAIRIILEEEGYPVGCVMCFVDDRRQNMGNRAQEFIDILNGNIPEDVKMNDKRTKIFNSLKKAGVTYVPQVVDLVNYEEFKKLHDSDDPQKRAIYDAYNQYNNSFGMASVRLVEGDAQYKREILDWDAKKVDKVNSLGGLRIFSFSDFEAHHLLDIVQIVQDCAAKGVKIQGYTKVPAFAKAMQATGMKVNRSHIARGMGYHVDENGNYYINHDIQRDENGKIINYQDSDIDVREGIDPSDPDFTEANGDIGNNIIGISWEHIMAAMADPYFHQIIPFHTGLDEARLVQKGIKHWFNFKRFQTEKDASTFSKKANGLYNFKKSKYQCNFYTDVIQPMLKRGETITAQSFGERFIEVCEQHGVVPRFWQVLDEYVGDDNQLHYKYVPGYEKLLVDYPMFDADGNYIPQEAVVPEFDDEFNTSVLAKYVETEQQKSTPEAIEKKNRAVSRIINEVVNGDSAQISKASDIDFNGEEVPAAQQAQGSFQASFDSVFDTADFDRLGMYYKSIRAVENDKQGKYDVNSLEKWMLGKGVKQDEINWLGIPDLVDELKSKGVKSIPRQELMDYLVANKLEIKKDVRGGQAVEEYASKMYDPLSFILNIVNDHREDQLLKNTLYQFTDNFFYLAYDIPLYREGYNVSDEIQSGTKIQDVLNTLEYIINSDEYSDAEKEEAWEYITSLSNTVKPEPTRFYENYSSKYSKPSYTEVLYEIPKIQEMNYKNKPWVYSAHWLDTENVVAHARMENTKSADGSPVRFIDEYQSDLHQHGRDKGYLRTQKQIENDFMEKYSDKYKAHTELQKTVSDLRRKINNYRSIISESEFYDNPLVKELFQELSDKENKLFYEFEDAETNRDYLDALRVYAVGSENDYYSFKRPPKAPFEKTWHEFLVNASLIDAINDGMDYLAWTTGATQGERYWGDTISKPFDVISYDSTEGTLTTHANGGRVIGRWWIDPDDAYNSLKNFVGKKAAEYLLSNDISTSGMGWFWRVERHDADPNNPDQSPTYYLLDNSGQPIPETEFKFGANGMRNFYDIGGKSKQNIPAYLTKVGKRFGVTPEWVELENGTKVPGIRITDEMKQTIPEQGFPMFSFAANSVWDNNGQQYGTYDNRSTRRRDANTPKQVNDDRITSKFFDNVMQNADITPEQFEDAKEAFANNGEQFSYEQVHLNDYISVAQQELAGEGYDFAVPHMLSDLDQGKVTPKLIVKGEQLLADAFAKGDTENALKLTAKLCVVSHEAGVALNAFKALRMMGGIGNATYVSMLVDRLNNKTYADRIKKGKMKPLHLDTGLVQDLANAKTETEINNALEAIFYDVGRQIPPTLKDAVNAWRYTAMLGNPVTHARNITGNIMMGGVATVKDWVATAIEHGFVDKSQWTHAVYNPLSAEHRAIREKAKESWEKNKNYVQGSGKLSFEARIKNYARTSNIEAVNAVEKFVSNCLEGEDAWSLKNAFVSVYTQYCIAQGYDPNNLTKAQEAEVVEHATLEAQKRTFRDPSWIAAWILQTARTAEEQSWLANILIEGVLPFKKTPINILRRGIEYSPIGLVKGAFDALVNVKNGKVSVKTAVDEIASGMTGSMLLALGMALARMGALRSRGEDEDEYEQFLEQTGDQQYAMTFHLGGQEFNINLSQLAPSAIPLFMGASLAEGLDSNTGMSLLTTLANAANPMMEMSFLSSLNQALSSYSSYNKNGETGLGAIGAVATSIGKSYASQFIPSLGGKIANIADDTKRTQKGFKNSAVGDATWDSYLRGLERKVPGLENTLEESVDSLGRTKKKTGFTDWLLSVANNLVLPANVNVVNRDAVDEEIINVFEMTGEKGVLPTAPSKYLTQGSGNAQQRYDFTADEYTQYSKQYGQAVYSAIKSVMADPKYVSASSWDVRAEMLKKAVENAEKTIRDIWKEEKFNGTTSSPGAMVFGANGSVSFAP